MNGDEPQTPKMFPTRVRSVGTIERRGSYWQIAADPQCIISLKRNFVRVDKAADGEIRIKSTPEVDADIQWFREKWALSMEEKDEALLHRGAEMHRHQARLAAQIDAGTYVPRAFEGMAKPPREYQKVAADLCLQNGSLLCGDDLGTGKTVVALTMLSDPRTLPAVVVTVTALPQQWCDKVAEFLPHLRTHILQGTTPYNIPERCQMQHQKACREAARLGLPTPRPWPKGVEPDVIVLPYSRLLGWMDVLKHKATTLVIDEAQELRHGGTDKARAAAAIRSRATYCLGLSATPVNNYGGEYYNVLQMIRPDALGTREEFMREYCIDTQEERKARLADPRSFGFMLRQSGLMLRRTRKDVGRELPPLTIIPTTIDADTGELDKVKHRVFELARTILGQHASTNFDKLKAGGEMDRILRQATGVAKAPSIAAFIRMLVESGEPVLVFAWHIEVYAILKHLLAGDPEKGVADLKPAFHTGQESEKQKREALAAFIAGKTKVLIMSLRSGAGIDGLQHVCKTVVIAELDWSPAVHDQGIGRINRDGQQHPVFAYYLLADQGSDPTVADVCGAKRANSEPARNPDESRADVVQTDPEHVKRLAQAYLDTHK